MNKGIPSKKFLDGIPFITIINFLKKIKKYNQS